MEASTASFSAKELGERGAARSDAANGLYIVIQAKCLEFCRNSPLLQNLVVIKSLLLIIPVGSLVLPSMVISRRFTRFRLSIGTVQHNSSDHLLACQYALAPLASFKHDE